MILEAQCASSLHSPSEHSCRRCGVILTTRGSVRIWECVSELWAVVGNGYSVPFLQWSRLVSLRIVQLAFRRQHSPLERGRGLRIWKVVHIGSTR